MKVLIINTSELTGGAAVASNRLMKSLNKAGAETKMLVLDKQTDDPDVFVLNSSFFGKQVKKILFLLERLYIFIHNGFNRRELFRVSTASTGINISNHRLVREADIIHLHWINQAYLSLENIRQLMEIPKPIVWTMHDMWPCTGICHHARGCDKFQAQCNSCYFLGEKKEKDISYKTFLKKKELYDSFSLTWVGCSNWVADKARKSNLTKGKNILSIPNPIDISVFKMNEKRVSREKLNLPLDKKLLLFGAVNISDERKGFSYLLEALTLFSETREVELVVFGSVKENITSLIPVKIHAMGYLTDTEKIVDLYNAVDVFVTSSLDENLPNTIMEAMACGTPCVGFDTGGIPEMIDHKVNGYVAEYKNVSDLVSGLDWTLQQIDSPEIRKACLEKVRNNYSEEIVSEKYIHLYNNIMGL